MRRLLNLAYAVLIDGLPIELRGEFDRRLTSEPEDEQTQEAPKREDAAAANRQAMQQLMGLMPGAVSR